MEKKIESILLYSIIVLFSLSFSTNMSKPKKKKSYEENSIFLKKDTISIASETLQEGECPACGSDTRSYLERSIYYLKDKIVESFKDLQHVSAKIAKNTIVYVEEGINGSQKEIQEKMSKFIAVISGILKWAHSE